MSSTRRLASFLKSRVAVPVFALILAAIALLSLAIGLVAVRIGSDMDLQLSAHEAVSVALRKTGAPSKVESVGVVPRADDVRLTLPRLAAPRELENASGPFWMVVAQTAEGGRSVFVVDDASGQVLLISQDVPGRQLSNSDQ